MVSVSKYPVSLPLASITTAAMPDQPEREVRQRENATPGPSDTGPSSAGPLNVKPRGRPSKTAFTATTTRIQTPPSALDEDDDEAPDSP